MLIPALLFSLISAMSSVQAQQSRTPQVLVFTATRGFRHDSIPTAIEVLGGLAGQANVAFSFTEDPGRFTDAGLSGYDCLMFVHNSDQGKSLLASVLGRKTDGLVLDSAGETALQNYFRSGGAYVGVHGASTCLQNNTNYQQAVGAIFDYHPQIQEATFVRTNTTHPAMVNVPDRWRFTEEVYYFRSDPRSNGAQLLLTVDESTYNNTGTSTGSYPSQGSPHPIAWYIESPRSAQPLNSGDPKAGRSFYTSLGHSNETWRNTTFQSHVLGGLRWALDGASTRAYSGGLVGNNGTALAASSASGASSTAQPSGSASASGSAAPSTSSRASAEGVVGRGGALKGAVGVAAAGVVGLGVLLS